MPKHAVKVVCLLAVMLAWSAPAQTQSAPPQPDAAAAAKEAAKELVTVMGLADQVQRILPMVIQQVKPSIVQGRPEVDRAYDQLVPLMTSSLNAHLADFVNGAAAIYASQFTAEELRQLTAFYQLPVGQKFLQKLPEITQQSMTLGQRLGQAAASDVQRRMIDELRKRGHNI